MTAHEFWRLLREWLEEHAPWMQSFVNPPATEAQISALESAIGQSLPAEFRSSCLLHDGCHANTGLIAGLGLMLIAEIQSNWAMWSVIAADDDEDLNEPCTSVPEGAVQLKYAHAGWLPFCGDSQNFIAIDFAPGASGVRAQVINTGRDDEIRHVIANDISGFFDFVAQQFHSGRVTVCPSETEAAPRWLAIGESADLLTALPELLSTQ